MFGYIKPFEPHMRISEYDTYQAAYCGLLTVMGKDYGLAAKINLSCDFAFLGLLALAVNDCPTETEQRRCFAYSFKKTPCLCVGEGFDFTAAAAMILIYSKLKDDEEDRRFIGKLGSKIMLRLTQKAYKKAADKYPDLAEYIAEQLKAKAKLEKENCKSIDKASEPYSNILAEIASRLSDDNDQKPLLRRFGYLIGRYIYIVDAFDDVERDFRKRSFNPLVLGNYVVNDLDLPHVQKKTEDSVNFTLGALADCYVQLEIKRFKPIIDNIVYLGLKNAFYDLIKKKAEKDETEQ